MRLAGQVALVTGGQRGIGAAVCRGFAREGAAVAVHHRPGSAEAEQAVALAGELRASGGQALAVAADVTDRDEVRAMAAAVRAGLGPVGVLVANAALSATAPWERIEPDAWRQVLAVCLDGTLFCAQAVRGDMVGRGGGSIITVSSVMAAAGGTGALHYVTAKAGLVGFTRALAREAGSEGIRVNCVMPGAIRTEAELERFPDQAAVAEHQRAVQSLARRGTPDDLVGAFVYLASAESAFVTGQTLAVDGGWVNR